MKQTSLSIVLMIMILNVVPLTAMQKKPVVINVNLKAWQDFEYRQAIENQWKKTKERASRGWQRTKEFVKT